jgi:hypothetical protein
LSGYGVNQDLPAYAEHSPGIFVTHIDLLDYPPIMSETQPLEVTVRLDLLDLRRGSYAIARERLVGAKWKRSLLQSMALFSVLFAVIFGINRAGPGFRWGAFIGALGGLVFWMIFTPLMLLFIYLVSYFTVNSALKFNPNIAGPFTYKFSEIGFSVVGPTGAGENNWAAFPWVCETREQFLLFVHKNLAYVIPKRCFTEKADSNSFKELLRSGYKGKLTLLK